MTATRMQLDELLGLPELPNWLAALEESFEETISRFEIDYLALPAMRMIQGGGKRLRPALVYAVGSLGNGSKEELIRGATAIELLHVGSLIHDDIIDRADNRRGVPTINKAEGVERAILAGDFLLGIAGNIGAELGTDVARSLSVAIIQLTRGQALECQWQRRPTRPLDDYVHAIEGKTAALMRASCEVGAHLARLPNGEVAAWAQFGKMFGMAFQIVDDVLDIVATEEGMGKPVGKDIIEGVYTLPLLMYRDTGGSLPDEEVDVEAARDLVLQIRRSGVIDAALAEARRYNRLATDAIDGFSSPVAQALARLPEMYLRGILRQQAGLELGA